MTEKKNGAKGGNGMRREGPRGVEARGGFLSGWMFRSGGESHWI